MDIRNPALPPRGGKFPTCLLLRPPLTPPTDHPSPRSARQVENLPPRWTFAIQLSLLVEASFQLAFFSGHRLPRRPIILRPAPLGKLKTCLHDGHSQSSSPSSWRQVSNLPSSPATAYPDDRSSFA